MMTPHHPKQLVGLMVVGEGLLAAAYVTFFVQVVMGDGVACSLLPVLIAGAGAVGGVAFNRLGAEAGVLTVAAGWILALAPLLAVWMFAAVLPPLGVGRAAPTAVDILFGLVIVAALLGTYGFLRDEDRRTVPYRAAGVACAVAGLAAVVVMVAGQPTALVAIGLVVALATHAVALYALWRAATTPSAPPSVASLV